MAKQLKRTELLEWRLLTIHDMDGKGTRRAINDELKRKLLLLKFPEREIDAKIGIGWDWTELKELELIERNAPEWRLTCKGKARVQELERSKKRDRERMGAARQAQEKRQAVKELAREADIAETKVWLLKKFSDISASRLGEILEQWRSESSAPSGTNVVECLPTPHQERMAVEEAAIKHIRKAEPKMGWLNTPTNNPGFDLYRKDQNGAVIAWCEVKTISGPFDARHLVALTAREFKEAQKRGQDYWLYVVENVGLSNIRIIRIQNPAGKSERFRFGHNWRNTAQDAAN